MNRAMQGLAVLGFLAIVGVGFVTSFVVMAWLTVALLTTLGVLRIAVRWPASSWFTVRTAALDAAFLWGCAIIIALLVPGIPTDAQVR